MRLLQWIRRAESRLIKARLYYGHGTGNASDEAAWIAAHSCRLSPRLLNRHYARNLSASERTRADDILHKRIATRVPAAYLLREAWLDGRRFYVDERVIVPRSFIAELLTDGLGPWISQSSQITRCLDLCTGSGCLAILAAKAFPYAQVDAVDISEQALDVARINVSRFGLEKTVRLIRSDLFAGVRKGSRFDLIISNPPYVNSRSMSRLPAEFRREPLIALAGGIDGLDLVRRILKDARSYLTKDGLLLMEIGHNKRVLERAFPQTPFTWMETAGGSGMVFLLRATELPP